MTKQPKVRTYPIIGKPATREEAEKLFWDEMTKHPGKRKGDPRNYITIVDYTPWVEASKNSLGSMGAIDYIFDEDKAKAAEVSGTVEPAIVVSNLAQHLISPGSTPRPTLSKLMIPLTSIVITKENPRTSMDETELAGLKASIKEVGQEEPVKVHLLKDGRYELVSGHRRVRVLQELGFAEAWAVVDDNEEGRKKLKMGVSNLNREDMNPIDLANWLKGCLEEDPELNQETLGRICGHEQAWVSNHLRLLKAPEDLQQKLISREMTPRHVMELLPLVGHPVFDAVMKEIKRKDEVTVDGLKRVISSELSHNEETPCVSTLGWDYEPIKQHFDRSECKGCTKKIVVEDWDKKKRTHCMDPKCFGRKVAAAEKLRSAELKKQVGELPKGATIDYHKYQQKHGYDTIERLPEKGSFGYSDADLSECSTCEKRKLDSKSKDAICLDPGCLHGKKATSTRAKNKRIRESWSKAMEEIDKKMPKSSVKTPAEQDLRDALSLLCHQSRTAGERALRLWAKVEKVEDREKLIMKTIPAADLPTAIRRVQLIRELRKGPDAWGNDPYEEREVKEEEIKLVLAGKAFKRHDPYARHPADVEEDEEELSEDEDEEEEASDEASEFSGEEDLVGEEGDGS